MKKLLAISLICLSLTGFAENLCPLAVGKDWKGWVKLDFIKVNGKATVMHLAGDDYLVDASVPDLGVREVYQITCIDNVVRTKDIKGSVTLKRDGNKIYVDHKQDNATAHFEHQIGHVRSLWDWLKR